MPGENVVQLCDICGEPFAGPDLGSRCERTCPECCHVLDSQSEA